MDRNQDTFTMQSTTRHPTMYFGMPTNHMLIIYVFNEIYSLVKSIKKEKNEVSKTIKVYVMKKVIFMLPFLLFFGCVSEDEHHAVLEENNKLNRELKQQKELVVELKKENSSLSAELEITTMRLEMFDRQIHGDAFVLTLNNGRVRVEGYEKAVEYLSECCQEW